MTRMPSQRFSGSGFDFVDGSREGAFGLAIARERGGPPRRAPSVPPARPAGRLRSMALETTAREVHADACRLYAAGQYAQARMKLLRLVGGSVLADEGHYGLACVSAASGDLTTARSHLLRVLALNPRHRSAVKALARIGG